ncbi:hypothetical protein CBS101457_004576 [Exobasidium rhododendri]|nr:hypothetical protein CBS101457_004576 [Exobasidium rhododendri]
MAKLGRGQDAGLLLEEETVAAQVTQSRSSSTTLGLTLLSAGLGNSLSAICTNPADIIKVRQQLQDKQVRSHFFSIAKSMAKQEGFRSFANGITATCCREMTYSTIRMGTYETFREMYSPIIPISSFGNKVIAGITSGSIGALVSTPTDLMKVRMQAPRPNGVPPYKNTFVGFYKVYQEGKGRAPPGGGVQGGIQSLWRGTTPNMVRAAILTASQLSSYSEAKNAFKQHAGMQEGFKLHLASSFVAGFVCSVCSQPVDVIKVRIMQDKSRALNGSLHSLAILLRNEGPLALYRGFAMCWLRLGVHSVISLVLFERFRALFGVKPL